MTVEPGPLRATRVLVPGDISSAAFLLVAGAVVPGGRVTVRGVGLNPTRTGILEVLAAMGARVGVEPEPGTGEPVGTVTVSGPLTRGASVGGALIPRLLDEVPALAVAALAAPGRTEIRDAAELRVKESDRLATLAAELGRLGAAVAERPDGLAIDGGRPLRGTRTTSHGDHRVAMALVLAGLLAGGETVVDDTACVATSFPTFVEALNRLAGTALVVPA